MSEPLTPELLLQAYASGYFPMAETRDDDALYWFHPEKRGVIPLDGFHIPASLAKHIRKSPYTITTNQAFPAVIAACSEDHETRPESWINPTIIALYTQLWRMGFAHSVECWEEEELVGGLYGVSLGGAFFGESMFSRKTNASKTALVYLVNLLKTAGYTLLDTQYVNDHLKQFGVQEISRKDYAKRLQSALKLRTDRSCFQACPTSEE